MSPKLERVAMAWRVACLDIVRGTPGKELAAELTKLLDQDLNEEQLIEAAKQVVRKQDLPGLAGQQLSRKLRVDLDRIMEQRDTPVVRASENSAFGSFDSLMSALDQGVKQIAAIEAGEMDAPDIDSLFAQTPSVEVIEEAAAELGVPEVQVQAARAKAESFSNRAALLKAAIERIRVQRDHERQQFDAVLSMVSQARFAGPVEAS